MCFRGHDDWGSVAVHATPRVHIELLRVLADRETDKTIRGVESAQKAGLCIRADTASATRYDPRDSECDR